MSIVIERLIQKYPTYHILLYTLSNVYFGTLLQSKKARYTKKITIGKILNYLLDSRSQNFKLFHRTYCNITRHLPFVYTGSEDADRMRSRQI